MKKLKNIQIINHADGSPAFVVLDYKDYQTLTNSRIPPDADIPSEVIEAAFSKQFSAIRVWREYLGLTQQEVAQRIGISQSAYSQHEKSSRLRKSTREKIAQAMGLRLEQLDF